MKDILGKDHAELDELLGRGKPAEPRAEGEPAPIVPELIEFTEREAMERSLELVRPFGRFVELGKRGCRYLQLDDTSLAYLNDPKQREYVKTIMENKPELVAVHKEAENFKLENQKVEASSIPWHPAAIKYFAEKGIKLK